MRARVAKREKGAEGYEGGAREAKSIRPMI